MVLTLSVSLYQQKKYLGMKPYFKHKIIRNWRKADAGRGFKLSPNYWVTGFASLDNLYRLAVKLNKSGLPRRVKREAAKKLL